MKAKRIIVSRVDNIGDVVLTLPMVGILKRYFASTDIVFLGRDYTRAVVECCEHVDRFLSWDDVAQAPPPVQADFLRQQRADVMIHVFPRRAIGAAARRAGIPIRIGSGRRGHHVWNCNRRLWFSRRKSDLHEAQLNVKLLEPLGIRFVPLLRELIPYYGMTQVKPLTERWASLLSPDRMNVILHPTTSGHAKRWKLEYYARLAEDLPEERYRFFVTGTAGDKTLIGDGLPFGKTNVTSLVGSLSLSELCAFVKRADALVSAATGPLHVAAALGKCAIGIFSPKRIGHPGRFAPVGHRAHALVHDPNCERCLDRRDCDCLQKVSPSAVIDILERERGLISAAAAGKPA